MEALEGRNITTDVDPVIPCAPHTRRRMILTARVTPKGQIVGFNRYQSHDVVAIEECPVSRPELVDALTPIRSVAALLANYSKEIRITVTLAENGIDVALEGWDKLSGSIATNPMKLWPLRNVPSRVRSLWMHLGQSDRLLLYWQTTRRKYGLM